MDVSATLIMVAALYAGTAQGIEIADRVEHYRVEGATARELTEQMQHRGPLNDVGQRANGLTHWQIEWTHASEMSDGACHLTALKVHIEVVTTLPQWQPPLQVKPSLIRQWEKFLIKLQQHEATHREHGLQAATAVREAVQAISPQVDCHLLERAIARAGRKEIRRYAIESRRYDTLTNFGFKEGVRLYETYPPNSISGGQRVPWVVSGLTP